MSNEYLDKPVFKGPFDDNTSKTFKEAGKGKKFFNKGKPFPPEAGKGRKFFNKPYIQPRSVIFD